VKSPIAAEQNGRLVSTMTEADRLLRAAAIDLTSVDPLDPDALRCLGRYFDELASRFVGGYDRGADGATDLDDFRPPQGGFLVAHLRGVAVGCGAIRPLGRRIGEIKRLWVSPEVRGLGVGRKILETLENMGRKREMTVIRLDTHESLTEAQQLYRSCGYREVDRFNDNPYAHRWFEKVLGT
jgi:ribosomal protein S18 acetylase RimI-like enzyme